MYVIFPADELIYMTYGAAIPRFKPRPTLDNLREPLVPFDTSPNHISNSQLLSSQNSQNSSKKNDQTKQNKKKSTKKEKATTDIFGYTPTSAEPSFYQEKCIDNRSFAPSQSKSQLQSIPSTPSTPSTPPIPSPSPSSSSTFNAKQPIQSIDNAKQPGKPKSRLHISLGRLGRSKQQSQPPEPARLRDITEIRIANPTFTRENISARNYDAFFESGEPVYSLEHRTPVTPQASGSFEINETTKRPNSFGLFKKMSKSKDATKVNARSRNSDPMSTVSEKGDRCHSLNEFILR